MIRFTTLSTIFLLTSICLLFPLMENPETYNIIPKKQITIIKNVKTPEIEISSDLDKVVHMNISYYNPSVNETVPVITDFELLNDYTLSIKENGYGFYIFKFLSEGLGKITISGKGIDTNSLLVIVIFFIIRTIVFINNRYFSSSD
ncbi:MAG: hypothetical protein OEY49_08860 [Candidatus Heimdallarchaeota archaeon]|nr:hypothetical protein [Candidatus Heimdallarchaeota archaeon]